MKKFKTNKQKWNTWWLDASKRVKTNVKKAKQSKQTKQIKANIPGGSMPANV